MSANFHTLSYEKLYERVQPLIDRVSQINKDSPPQEISIVRDSLNLELSKFTEASLRLQGSLASLKVKLAAPGVALQTESPAFVELQGMVEANQKSVSCFQAFTELLLSQLALLANLQPDVPAGLPRTDRAPPVNPPLSDLLDISAVASLNSYLQPRPGDVDLSRCLAHLASQKIGLAQSLLDAVDHSATHFGLASYKVVLLRAFLNGKVDVRRDDVKDLMSKPMDWPTASAAYLALHMESLPKFRHWDRLLSLRYSQPVHFHVRSFIGHFTMMAGYAGMNMEDPSAVFCLKVAFGPTISDLASCELAKLSDPEELTLDALTRVLVDLESRHKLGYVLGDEAHHQFYRQYTLPVISEPDHSSSYSSSPTGSSRASSSSSFQSSSGKRPLSGSSSSSRNKIPRWCRVHSTSSHSDAECLLQQQHGSGAATSTFAPGSSNSGAATSTFAPGSSNTGAATSIFAPSSPNTGAATSIFAPGSTNMSANRHVNFSGQPPKNATSRLVTDATLIEFPALGNDPREFQPSPTDSRPYTFLYFGEPLTKWHALIDSGSQISLIHPESLPPGSILTPSSDLTIQSPAGVFHNPDMVSLEVCYLDRPSVQLTFAVVDAGYPVLIGYDMMKQLGIVIQHDGIVPKPISDKVLASSEPQPPFFSDVVLSSHRDKFMPLILAALQRNADLKSHTCSHPAALYDLLFKLNVTVPPAVSGRRYTIPESQKQAVAAKILEMLEKGIIQVIPASASPHRLGLVIASKPNGDVRVCLNTVPLNVFIQPYDYPIPVIADLYKKLSGFKVASQLDIVSAYNCLPVTKRTSKYLTFNCPAGVTYQFTHAPFGLTDLPGRFQFLLESILAPFSCCIVYFDNIIVFSDSLEEHADQVCSVIDCLTQYNLPVSVSKSEFFCTSFKMLGCIVSVDGLSIDPDKASAVADIPIPKTHKELQSFLGKANYLSNFVLSS